MKITTGSTQKDTKIVEITPSKVNVLHYDVEYDACKPEETIRDFVARAKAMVSKYEFNKSRILEIEQEMTDLCHYIEIAPFKNVPEGYKLYRKMAELRRERRACKNENDLLQPVYEHFHATAVLDKLSGIQGECAKCKSAIDARYYNVRTGILDEWINPPVKVDVITEKDDEDTGIDMNESPFTVNEENPIGEEVLEDMDDLDVLKKPGKTEHKPMSAFKQVWRAAK